MFSSNKIWIKGVQNIMEKISLIVPCYNEEEVLPYFYEEFQKVAKELEGYRVEVIFVDDGSKDRTIQVIRKWLTEIEG